MVSCGVLSLMRPSEGDQLYLLFLYCGTSWSPLGTCSYPVNQTRKKKYSGWQVDRGSKDISCPKHKLSSPPAIVSLLYSWCSMAGEERNVGTGNGDVSCLLTDSSTRRKTNRNRFHKDNLRHLPRFPDFFVTSSWFSLHSWPVAGRVYELGLGLEMKEKTHASSPSTSGKTHEKTSVIQTRRLQFDVWCLPPGLTRLEAQVFYVWPLDVFIFFSGNKRPRIRHDVLCLVKWFSYLMANRLISFVLLL